MSGDEDDDGIKLLITGTGKARRALESIRHQAQIEALRWVLLLDWRVSWGAGVSPSAEEVHKALARLERGEPLEETDALQA